MEWKWRRRCNMHAELQALPEDLIQEHARACFWREGWIRAEATRRRKPQLQSTMEYIESRWARMNRRVAEVMRQIDDRRGRGPK